MLVGDVLEKGRESLALLRHVMDLSRSHTVYCVCGNCDGLVLRFFETDALDGRFFSVLPAPASRVLPCARLAREGGFDRTEDLPQLRAGSCARPIQRGVGLAAIAMPTILETEHLVFVHGGVPSLQGMEALERWALHEGRRLPGAGVGPSAKWVIVGHWPVTLYDPRDPLGRSHLCAPERKIILHRRRLRAEGWTASSTRS